MSLLCRRCSEPVRWARTSKGRSAPYDARPDVRGQFLLVPLEDGVLSAVHDSEATFEQKTEAGPDRYVSHLATCRSPLPPRPSQSLWRHDE